MGGWGLGGTFCLMVACGLVKPEVTEVISIAKSKICYILNSTRLD